MIINNNKVLIQTPKCGTMTTMRVGNKYQNEKKYIIFNGGFNNIHSRYDQGVIQNRITPDMNVYVFSRNPYNRVASAFFFRKVSKSNKQVIQEARINRLKQEFQKFVLDKLEKIYNEAHDFDKHNRMYHYFFRTQYDYIKDCPHNQLHIYKLNDKESLLNGLNSFFDLNIESVDELPQQHRSLGMPSYIDFYTPEMIEIVNRLYAVDFEYFNYPKIDIDITKRMENL